MNWLFFTILAVIVRSFYSTATKVLANKVKVSAAGLTLLLSFTALIVSLVLSPLLGGIVFTGIGTVWLPVLLMILGQSIANILFFKGQNELDSGPTQIYLSSMLLWSLLLSMPVLGSRYSIFNLFGVVVLATGILIAQYDGHKKKLLSKGALYIIISAIFFSVFQVSSALVADVLSPATYIVITYGGMMLILSLIYNREIKEVSLALKYSSSQVILPAMFAAITSVLNFTFLYKAYSTAPNKGTVALLSISHTIFSVLLGVLILGETKRLSQKLAAAALAVLAGFLIKS